MKKITIITKEELAIIKEKLYNFHGILKALCGIEEHINNISLCDLTKIYELSQNEYGLIRKINNDLLNQIDNNNREIEYFEKKIKECKEKNNKHKKILSLIKEGDSLFDLFQRILDEKRKKLLKK